MVSERVPLRTSSIIHFSGKNFGKNFSISVRTIGPGKKGGEYGLRKDSFSSEYGPRKDVFS